MIRIDLTWLVVVASAAGVVIVALIVRLCQLNRRLRMMAAGGRDRTRQARAQPPATIPKENVHSAAATVPTFTPAAAEAPVASPAAGDIVSRVAAFLEAGQKIMAIKALRESTGLGLKEAKDTVETIARQLNIR